MSRPSEHDSVTPRRQFIGELAAGAAALAAVACSPAAAATSASSQAPAPAAPPSASKHSSMPETSELTWDTSWMNRITAKHKVVFDSPQINDGDALYNAAGYFDWVKDVFKTGDSDSSIVVVLRHAAVPMLYNDAMWAKYDFGAETKTTDPSTKKAAKRNVYYRKLDKDGKPATGVEGAASIAALTSRGVILPGMRSGDARVRVCDRREDETAGERGLRGAAAEPRADCHAHADRDFRHASGPGGGLQQDVAGMSQ
jgi:hypothetical protein